MESFLCGDGGGRASHQPRLPALPLPCFVLAAASHQHTLRQRWNNPQFCCDSLPAAAAAHNRHFADIGNQFLAEAQKNNILILPSFPTIRSLAMALLFGGSLAIIKTILSALPPDFVQRWHGFLEECNSGAFAGYKKKKENVIYDVNGEVIVTFGDSSGYDYSKASLEIPSVLREAVVACEDRRFFRHRGIDPRGLARAILSLSRNGGGSTITQQLVKNVFLKNERTLTRKILEMLLASLIETRMSKQDILHAYLCKIYWGHGIHGIEAAANFYFGKPPLLLTIGECAMLAGMIPAPEILSPFRDPSGGKQSQRRALQRMVETGILDENHAQLIISQDLQLRSGPTEMKSRPCRAPFFVDEVISEVEKRYGHDRLSEGGLKIYTTLDLHMQSLAEMIIEEEMNKYDKQRKTFAQTVTQECIENAEGLEKSHANRMEGNSQRVNHEEYALQFPDDKIRQEFQVAVRVRLEASMIGIDPSTGGVRVLVGGRDYCKSSSNWATRAYRSPGTTFSPVVYLAALAEGINRKDMLVDVLERREGKDTPENLVLKPMIAPPIVRLCEKVGTDKVRMMGKLLGITAPLPSDFTLGLGQFKVTPIELATVYATIAARGIFHKPYLITHIETKEGEILEKHHVSHTDRVVSEHVIIELHKLLQAVVQRGSGKNAQTRMCAAGMPGTSSGHHDAWFAGFTPYLSCLVWQGYDDNSCVGSRYPGTGASHAAVIWKHFMESVYEDLPNKRRSQLAHRKGCKTSRQSLKKVRNRWKLPKQVGIRKIRQGTEG